MHIYTPRLLSPNELCTTNVGFGPLLHRLQMNMKTLHFLADDHAELMVGGTRRHSSGSTTTTTTTNYTFSLGQSNSALNLVLGGGGIMNGQSNEAYQGIGV
jgi:hypothetical protein